MLVVQQTLCIAAEVGVGFVQLHQAQQGHTLKWAHIGQFHPGAAQRQQRLLAGVGQGHVVCGEMPGDAHLCVGRLRKLHLQIGPQGGLHGAHCQVFGQVVQVGREVEATDFQRGLGGPVVVKRLRMCLGLERAAVEFEGQFGLNAHLFGHPQGADEGDGQCDVRQRMAVFFRGVVQVHLAVQQLDVVDGQACGAGVWLGWVAGLGQPVQHVLQVVLTLASVAQVQHGLVNLHGVHHRGPAQHRRQLCIHINTLNR